MLRISFLLPHASWPKERHVGVVAYNEDPIGGEVQAYFYDSDRGDCGPNPSGDLGLWEALGFARTYALQKKIPLLAVRARPGMGTSQSRERRLALATVGE